MKSLRVLTLLSVLALLLSSCSLEREEILATSGSGYDVGSTSIPYSTFLDGYMISFEGREFDGETTTFSYTVSGGQASSVLDMFFLEIPACAPRLESYYPVENAYIGTNPYIQIYGVKWEGYIYPGGSGSFTVSYVGDVPLGTIATAVKVAENVSSGEIAGPCKGAVEEYEISGAIFIDVDGDGIRDGADVSGIADVTVRLNNGGGGIYDFKTGPDGLFDFLVPAGTYALSIPAVTDDTDFNEALAASFDATTSLSRLITIGPDSQDNLFGFKPRTGDITQEIIEGTILTDGIPARIWVRHMRAALHDQTNDRLLYDGETLLGFLHEIEGLFITDPFQFTPGSEFEEAIEILKGGSPQPEKALIRELLAAELNHVSGRGMVGNLDLQVVMLAWVEELVYDIQHPEINQTVTTSHDMLKLSFGDIEVDEAISFLESLNCAIGGGSGGGG